MQESNQQYEVIFIRHAESQANLQADNFVNKYKVIYDWEHLSKNRDFLNEVKYAGKLVDPPITPQGYEQCSKAREQLNQYQPDLILVSPLNRALTTCQQIFRGQKCPVIVQPMLSEGLRSSSDCSFTIQSKKERFPEYDFSRVEKLGDLWFFSNQSLQNQEKYKQVYGSHEGKDHLDVLNAVFEYMKETFIYETPTNLRRRTQSVMEMLKQYKKQYKRIAVVTHYNIIRFSLAKEFNQRDEPVHNTIENCQILKIDI